MEHRTVVRVLKVLRLRKGWSQRDVGARIGISQSQMSRWERTALEEPSVPNLERWAAQLGAHLSIELRVDGERPLHDQRHASIQAKLAAALRAAGWIVDVEVSFNEYGDRGRIDVLAFHPGLGILLVIEVKTRLDDAQDLLGRLDIKRRVAPGLAKERGWAATETATVTVPMIAIQDGRTARRPLSDHTALFTRYNLRARAATAWLSHPTLPPPTGILTFTK
jgi:transcriptional regulator with XRE-family HTH domain